jgi:hypothetical protein
MGPYIQQIWKAYNARANPPDGLTDRDQTKARPTPASATRPTAPGPLKVIGMEIPIFTDVDEVYGQIGPGLGPFKLLNLFSAGTPSSIPRIILRTDLDFPLETDSRRVDTDKSSASYYHGGSLGDEIAALLSLAAGVRLKAGAPDRLFLPDDPLEMSTYREKSHDPRPPSRANHPLLPRYPSSFCLNDYEQKLAGFMAIDQQMASAILRSARCYQIGLWHSEEDPQYAWMSLISAAESAADYHYTEKVNPVETLKAGMPDLYELLKKKAGCDQNWLTDVAKQLKGLTGATKKFVDFLLEFWPDAPTRVSRDSPRKWFQQAWSPDNGQSRDDWEKKLRDDLKNVYGWRSKHLHAGVALPPFMLRPPNQLEDGWEERPCVPGMGDSENYWSAKDVPMLLHTFEHIVRGALLKWWDKAVDLQP